jgi:alkyl hydroperoxide reductase subunit AhpC
MSPTVTTRALQVGDEAPDFIAVSTAGVIHFHDWIGPNWCLLFSHIADFDEVCTTEVAEVARMQREFDRRDVLVVGVSIDEIDTHRRWAATITERHGAVPRFPLIADTDTTVSRRYGMLRHGAGPHADAHSRSAFVIGPDKRIELSLSYPLTTGRNFWEILRVVDSLQLAARSRVATPANWQPGEDVVMRSVIDRVAPHTARAVS